jgi:ribose 5-phosphate isomerase A
VSLDSQKRAAARYAASLVQPNTVVGLGSGSTAELAVHALGGRFREGLRFVGVPTSPETEELARAYGIPVSRLDNHPALDLDIDGADEVDRSLNLVKGRGGALLREKLVAAAANRFVAIVDETKLVDRLGERAPIPIEVVPFGWTTTRRRLEALGLECELRRVNGHVFKTSNHNYILDCRARPGLDLSRRQVGDTIKSQIGVVEHGLFLEMATSAVVGTADGRVEVMERSRVPPPA